MIWIFRFFSFLAFVLPIKAVLILSKFLGIATYCLGLYRKGRRNVVENLRQVGISSCGLSSFVGFARNISEFLVMPKLNRKSLCHWVEPIGIGRLDTELDKGKGVILLTGHLGTWELGAAALSARDYSTNVVSIRYINEAVTDFYERRRKRKGIKVIYIEDVRSMLKALRRGQVLAILGDKVYSGEGVEVEFFGKTAKFSLGAFWLAQKTQASIVPVFTVHDKGRARLCFEEPIYVKDKKDIPLLLSQYVGLLEKYIKQYPVEWCAFDPIWD